MTTWPSEKEFKRALDAGNVCGNCWQHADDHRLVNYADGPQIGLAFMLCPSVPIFVDARTLFEKGEPCQPRAGSSSG